MASLMEQFQRIANEYMDKNGLVSTHELAAHALRNKLWFPEEKDLISQCARLFARAMRQEFFVDPQGRRVRAKHAAMVSEDGEQQSFWGDLRTAPPEHIRVSFQQRREQILGECHHLKTAVDSFNDNLNDGEQIRIVFDFTEDLRELEEGNEEAA